MTELLRIADALSRPLLMHPAKLEVILGALDGRLPGIELEAAPLTPDASRFVGAREGGRPYQTQSGIAFIPIIGSLANRGAYIGASSGITSYEGIAAQLRMAADDSAVHSIVLDIDSPGGEATGMFRLANLVRQVRATKRIVTFVDDMAASAAYGIASQADEIVVSPSSIVGSIGVVLTHVDRSAEMEKAGRKVTLIHAGAHKVDGHPFGPLSDQVRADLQAQVLAFYDQLLATVAAGRSRLTREAARATEARTLIGQAAIAAGLADRIGTLDSVVADLLTRHHSKAPNRSGNHDMTVPFSAPPTSAATRPAAATAIAAPIASTPTVPLTPAQQRAADERARKILGDPRVFGHEPMATELAATFPHLTADAIGAKVANLTGQRGMSRTAGLAAAIDRLVGAQVQVSASRPSPVSEPPRSGLALAVDELVAERARGPGSSSARSGLADAVDQIIGQSGR